MALETYSGFYEGYTISELESMVYWYLGQVSGTTISYSRFPQWLIRHLISERQQQFVFQSQCLRKMALLVCKADRRVYKLPSNCMDNGVISAKYYDSSTSYEKLDLIDTQWLDSNRDGWLTEDSSTPEKCYMGESYGNIPMLGVHPMPDTDGTDYTLAPETGIAIGGDLPATSSNITGTATGGSATALDDTEVDFTAMGLVEGIAVVNVTDSSIGYIEAVAATELTLTTMSGGTANAFASGDSYNILAGEYGVVTSWSNDEQYLFSSELGLLAAITVPAGNIRIDYIPYPLPFSYSINSNSGCTNDDQKPEIPKLFHEALVYGAVADCLRSFNENTKEFSRAAEFDGKHDRLLAAAAMQRKDRPFEQKETRMVPKFAVKRRMWFR